MQERASEGAEGHAAATDGSLLHESSSNTHNTSNRQSVHGVVASLIRAAEKTRFKALDRPQSLQSKRLSSSQRLSSQQVQFQLFCFKFLDINFIHMTGSVFDACLLLIMYRS